MPFHRPMQPEPLALRLLGDAIDLAIVALGAVLVVVMFGNVLSRAILNLDIAWNTEFGEFVLVWATFLGGAAAARRGLHMRIAEFLDLLQAKLRRQIEAAIDAGVLFLLAILTWRGAAIVERTIDQEMSVLYWPVGLQYAAMPVGSALTAVFVAHQLVRRLREA